MLNEVSWSSYKSVLLAYFWDLWRKQWAIASPSSLTKVFFPPVESVKILSFMEFPLKLVQIFPGHSHLQTFLLRIQAAETILC